MFVATDLHGHTTFSDGRTSPEEFVRFRQQLGIKIVAVSDHDVYAASRRAAATAREVGIIAVPAAETTAMFHFGTERAEQVHVLAYFPPAMLDDGRLERTALYRRGLEVQRRWREHVLEWMAGLAPSDRAALDPKSELPGLGADVFPALQPVIDLIALRRRELFEGFRRHHVRFWMEDRELFGWEPEELIDQIRHDGGVDVVAHAVRYKDKDRLDRLLRYATGVEVYTSRHTQGVAARYRKFAEREKKLWTASSDDHQHQDYVRPPSGTPVVFMERILGRAVPPEMISGGRDA